MSTTYTWRIVGNDVNKTENGLELVIKKIHAQYIGISEDGFEGVYPTYFEFEAPHEAAYIPYEEVTNEMRINWILASGSPTLELAQNAVDYQIQEKREQNYIPFYPLTTPVSPPNI